MPNSLHHFIKALNNIELYPNETELADMLWLAEKIKQINDITPENPDDVSEQKEPITPARPTEDISPPSPIPAASTSITTPTPQPPSAPLYAKTSDTTGMTGAYSFRAPTVSMLPAIRELERALQPFKRRVRSRNHLILNEKATVQRFAEQGFLIPVQQGRLERQFEIALVIERSSSMVVWHPTLREFRILLEQYGAFRDVRTWYLHTDIETQIIKLYAGKKAMALQGAAYSPAVLKTPQQQRLIVLVSDCVSGIWREGRIDAVIAQWITTHPVVLVQLLPPRLWPGTGLGKVPVVKFAGQYGAVNNRILQVISRLRTATTKAARSSDISAPSISPKKKEKLVTRIVDKVLQIFRPSPAVTPVQMRKPEPIKLPIITLEPVPLANWAKFVVGRPRITLPGVMLAVPRQTKRSSQSLQSTSQTAKDKIVRFRATASPLAQELAIYLSAVPLTLPIMRLVQQLMLPDSGQIHLAEFFLSGLIKRVSELHDNPDLLEYEFFDGVRADLQEELWEGDGLRIVFEVTQYLESHLGQSRDFQALLLDPSKAGDIVLSGELRKLANISCKVLRKLGGEWAVLANRIEIGTPRTFTTIINDIEEKEFTVYEKVLTVNGVKLEMVYIPAGEFWMGSKDGEGYDDERPRHKVRITQAFYLGKYPVTQAQYQAVLGTNPSHFKEENRPIEQVSREGAQQLTQQAQHPQHQAVLGENPAHFRGENRPVEMVSWEDAQRFCKELSSLTKQTFRLPSEAEWEYACRAGTETAYSFGNDKNKLEEFAWYGENSDGQTHEVGNKKPNGFGLYDMHGNVWEWCEDDWENNYNNPRTQQAYKNGSKNRLLRGGSWINNSSNCCSGYRVDISSRNGNLGFRLLLLIPSSC